MTERKSYAENILCIVHTAASAGVSGAPQQNIGCRGLVLFVNVTAITGTGATLNAFVEGFDTASGVWYPIAAPAAISAAGFMAVMVYPGLNATATSYNAVLPDTWRARTAIAGTTPAVTATVSTSMVP